MMIHFGTGGWRAIIADEFTKENIRLVTAGLLSYRDHYETGFHDLLSENHGSNIVALRCPCDKKRLLLIAG